MASTLLIVPKMGTAVCSLSPHWDANDKFYVVQIDGSPPRQVLAEFFRQHKLQPGSAVWHPDGKRVCVWVSEGLPSPSFWTVPIAGGMAIKWEIAPAITR